MDAKTWQGLAEHVQEQDISVTGQTAMFEEK